MSVELRGEKNCHRVLNRASMAENRNYFHHHSFLLEDSNNTVHERGVSAVEKLGLLRH